MEQNLLFACMVIYLAFDFDIVSLISEWKTIPAICVCYIHETYGKICLFEVFDMISLCLFLVNFHAHTKQTLSMLMNLLV